MKESQILSFIRNVEEENYSFGDWGHNDHLVTAVWYLEQGSDGFNQIRQIIKKYNDSQGLEEANKGSYSGYHDTLTCFLVKGIDIFLKSLPTNQSIMSRVMLTQKAFQDFRGDILVHYSKEILNSVAARSKWIAPDLQSLEMWLETCSNRASGQSDIDMKGLDG